MSLSSPVLAFSLGGPELLLILAVVLLLFGAKKLPELARGLGQSIKEFKKSAATDETTHEPARAPDTLHAAPEPKKIEPTRTHTHGTN